MLIRDGGAFFLRRDQGGRYLLELQRTPVDLVEKRVRLVAHWSGLILSAPTASPPHSIGYPPLVQPHSSTQK